jgi:ABC-type transport system substrate-binding protein
MLTRIKTINSFTLAVALVLLFGGAAYGLTQVTREVSATVDVQISAPNGIEIYLDAARTLPANNFAFGTIVLDPFGTPSGQRVNPVPVWVENQSNSIIELTLSDDFNMGNVALRGPNQSPILQPGEVLPVELLLNFHQGVAGTYPFTVMFQVEGPVPPPTEVTVYPGELRVMVQDFASERFDVAFSLGLAGDLNYGRIIHGFLISDNERREMVPGIASAWNLSDDGLTWTFTIREGVMWQDGTELTPDDVAWSFQRLFGPEAVDHIIAPIGVRLSRVGTRTEVSGRDVKLITSIPSTYIGSTLSESGTGWYHVMPARDELYNTEVEVAYDANPIGAGPMKLVNHVRSPLAPSGTHRRWTPSPLTRIKPENC